MDKCIICGGSIEDNSLTFTIKGQKVCDLCHARKAYKDYVQDLKKCKDCFWLNSLMGCPKECKVYFGDKVMIMSPDPESLACEDFKKKPSLLVAVSRINRVQKVKIGDIKI